MIPEGSPNHNDLIDIIIQSAQVTKDVVLADGSTKREVNIDEETIWWKTLSVASATFGRMAFELKEWERNAFEATTNMCSERATNLAHQIIEVGVSFRKSIDAKSSESMGIKDHAQSTLIDKINKNKIEKVHTFKGEMKKSMMDVFLGREADREADED